MDKIWIPVVFQIGALVVGVAEVIIPSFGILTIIALALLGYSWFFIFQNLPQAAVWSFLLADVIMVPVFIKLAFSLLKRSPLSHTEKLSLGPGLNNTRQSSQNLVGKTGIVDSQLRPTGKALFGEQLMEVVSEGTIIEKGTEIRIIEVNGNKIIVEPILSDQPGETS